jgi:hypothetical protein
MERETYIARLLAPEDIRPGTYVSVMYVVDEHMPDSWERGESWRASGPLRYVRLPWEGATPVRVVEVCLPFVLVKTARGKHRTLDVRRYRLGRVSDHFGRRVFEQIEAERREAECREKKQPDKGDGAKQSE